MFNYHDDCLKEAHTLQPNTFDVLSKRKRIIMFKRQCAEFAVIS